MNIGRYRRKIERAQRRRMRVRRCVRGHAERPRLTVNRTLRHMYAQIIDDDAGRTLLGLSSRSPEVVSGGDKRERSMQLGLLIAAKAKALGIEAVVFDRDRYLYHGRIKQFAEGARKGGLQF